MKWLNKLKQKIWLAFTASKRAKLKELKFLEKQLKMLQHAKTITVNEHNFEAASWYREKEKILAEKINYLKQKIKHCAVHYGK